MNTKFLKTVLLISILGLFTFSSCDNDDDDPIQTQIENNLESGLWRITRYVDSGDDETSNFTGFNFNFDPLGVVTATNGSTTSVGTWSISDSNSSDDSIDDLDFNLLFIQPNEFAELSDDWDIISQSSNKLELTDVSGGGGGTDFLTFEKN